MIWALLLIPTMAGLLAMAITAELAAAGSAGGRGRDARRAGGGLLGSKAPAPAVQRLDGARCGRLLFLSITSALFLAAAVYAVGYLANERKQPDISTTKRNCRS